MTATAVHPGQTGQTGRTGRLTRSLDPRQGLPWTILRLHRAALWFWAPTVTVGAAALLWAYGPGADAAWAEHQKNSCAAIMVDSCDTGFAYVRYNLAVTFGAGLLIVAPALAAAWAGGSLIGRDMENGTAALLWTQSVSPTRWLAAKLAVPAVLLVSGTVALTLLHRLTWYGNTDVRDVMGAAEWYDATAFLPNGILATAYVLLGLALGALAGLLLRRALPALGAALAGLIAVRAALEALRPSLWPVETVVMKDDEAPSWSGMYVEHGAVTSTGDHVPDRACLDGACSGHEIVGYYADYHPESHYWPLQLVETGIVLALTALLVLAAFRLLNRRTGGVK
ncbi:ABC transporter permease [Streptomyces sp. NPDC002845]